MRHMATRGVRAAAASLLCVLFGSTFAASQPATTTPGAAPVGATQPAEESEAATPAPQRTSSSSSAPLCAAGRVTGPDVMATVNKGAAPPPPPTPQQLAAFEVLKREAQQYTVGARDFRRTLNTIVRHHYEERRRRVLSALDKELSIEKEGLGTARGEAIRRLEEFVATYSGTNADPEATPDAMFRLASLYEERARDDFDADLTTGLE